MSTAPANPINPLDYSAPVPLARSRASSLLSLFGPLLGLIFVFALFAILTQFMGGGARFATLDNMETIFRQTTVVGIAALGMTMIIISGGIDLSVGSAMAVCSVSTAWILNRTGGLGLVGSTLAGITAGMCCGALMGSLVTVFKLPPFIASLGLWGALRGLAMVICEIHNYLYQTATASRIEVPAVWKETWLKTMVIPLDPGRRWMLFPPGVWLMLALAAVVAATLRYTRFGRHVFAVGSNEQTARLCGVNVGWTKFRVYALSGMLVGIAGVLAFAEITSGEPSEGKGIELDVIAAVVIGGASLTGGAGTITGTLIGALIMKTVGNGCQKIGISNSVQQIVTGGIIVLAALIDRLRHRRSA